VKEDISVIDCIFISKQTANQCLIITLVTLVMLLLVFSSCSAYAYEDVPPAVPVDAVEVVALPLPEPIYAKSEEPQEQSSQEYREEKETQTPKNINKPNMLERFLQKTSDSSIAVQTKTQNEQNWVKEEQVREEHEVIVASNTPPIDKKETGNYSTKVLMPIKPEGSGFYVLELFTTQACPFCPKADAMMETYSSLSHVIALSCHVDYFDVPEGSLSLPICSARQKRYEAFLKGSPKYTPQMVVNGRYDAAGYLSDKIAKAFKQAHNFPVGLLTVEPVEPAESKPPTYRVELLKRDEGRYHLWLIAYDQPHPLTVRGGANAGKDMVYYNVVSKAEFLGSWDGQPKDLTIETEFLENTKGFAFLVQDVDTGAILMAGKNE